MRYMPQFFISLCIFFLLVCARGCHARASEPFTWPTTNVACVVWYFLLSRHRPHYHTNVPTFLKFFFSGDTYRTAADGGKSTASNDIEENSSGVAMTTASKTSTPARGDDVSSSASLP